ncbi:MAG TPA: GWxTD domain-containing protein [Gemmatimonadales bacterium]|nr:GWxTD domain-containing protein [Gemmatimonadales bacterium]
MIAVRLAALAAMAVLGGPMQSPAPDGGLILRAVRSYRAEQGRTEVNAFVQVPYAVLEPSGEGNTGTLSYRVGVKVTDSTGLTLLQQSWQNHAPASVRGPSAFGVEMVRFSLAPGRYSLEVTVEDSVSGHKVGSLLALEGYKSAPPASDLLLSPRIRAVTAGDTVPMPAELRWGRMLVTAAAQLELTPLRATAYYLLEAYSAQEARGTLTMKVVDSGGKALTTTAPTPVTVPAGGGVLKGQLDLSGLPPGQYTMAASLDLSGKTVERSAAFAMAGLDETLEKDVARREASKGTDEGYFEAMDEKAIEVAKEPLVLIAQSGELSKYSKDLSLRAKRRFMVEFWQKRDLVPGTPENETRQKFYAAVDYANRMYGEKGRAAVPGWKTDRGRIYVKNGTPDEMLQRPQAGRSPPYEVWRFRTGKDRYYIFIDRANGLGNFQLVYSNDIKEPGQPNWQELLHKQDAVDDISRFLGIEIKTGVDNQDRF